MSLQLCCSTAPVGVTPFLFFTPFTTMTTLTLLNNLHHLQSTITAVWMGFSELFTAAAMLWCLNALARAIRIVYIAGLYTGYVSKRYIIPALLWTADHISLLISKIDWAEVRIIVTECSKVILAAVVAAVSFSIDHLRRDIPLAYNWVERNFIDVPDANVTELQLKPVRTIRRHGRLVPVGFAS